MHQEKFKLCIKKGVALCVFTLITACAGAQTNASTEKFKLCIKKGVALCIFTLIAACAGATKNSMKRGTNFALRTLKGFAFESSPS